MSIEQCLREYSEERFTDDDVVRCTGLSFRAWRELLRAHAVRTISKKRGRGRVRLCDATTLIRAAAIAAINQAGLSLPVSGQIAVWWPFHRLLFEVCDPRSILGAVIRPNVDWFEPNMPAGSEPGDWLIEVYDSRFVGARYGSTNEPVIFGDVRDAGMRFVAWYPSHSKQHVIGTAIEQLARKILPYHPSVDFTTDIENVVVRNFPQELKSFGYKFEDRSIGDPLRRAAANAVRNAVVVVTVNPTLAIRKALRRYLGLEPDLVVAKQSRRRRR
jgi:hypothetical protein